MNLNPHELFSGNDKLVEANNLSGMGAVLEKRGEFEQAQRYFEEALALYEEIFGQHHLTTAFFSLLGWETQEFTLPQQLTVQTQSQPSMVVVHNSSSLVK